VNFAANVTVCVLYFTRWQGTLFIIIILVQHYYFPFPAYRLHESFRFVPHLPKISATHRPTKCITETFLCAHTFSTTNHSRNVHSRNVHSRDVHSRIVHSRDVHPCYLVPQCPLPRCPPMLFGAALSTPAMSTPAFLTVPRCPLPQFQSPHLALDLQTKFHLPALVFSPSLKMVIIIIIIKRIYTWHLKAEVTRHRR